MSYGRREITVTVWPDMTKGLINMITLLLRWRAACGNSEQLYLLKLVAREMISHQEKRQTFRTDATHVELGGVQQTKSVTHNKVSIFMRYRRVAWLAHRDRVQIPGKTTIYSFTECHRKTKQINKC